MTAFCEGIEGVNDFYHHLVPTRSLDFCVAEKRKGPRTVPGPLAVEVGFAGKKPEGEMSRCEGVESTPSLWQSILTRRRQTHRHIASCPRRDSLTW